MYVFLFLYNTIFGDFMILNNQKIKDKVKNNGQEKHKIKNFFLAFLFGGLFGIVGQAIFYIFNLIINLNEDLATILTSIIFVSIAFIMTCFGIFDKFAQIAHAGILIPITGFANSITASALEGKAEGMIYGIGSKMFSLVGSVCTYGIVSAIILGIIYFIVGLF